MTDAPLQLSYREGGPVISVKALPAGEESLDLRIYHTGGSLVQRHRLTEGETLDLTGLNPGIYILSARGRQFCWTQKIRRL